MFELKQIKNRLDKLSALADNFSVNESIKKEIQVIRKLASKALMSVALKIEGRENSSSDINSIMDSCSIQDKYGNILNPFNLKEEDFRPLLFAESLSREMRFWNQTDLSVAEHCVNMANLFPNDKRMAQWALIHEIYEAYTGDLATPYKKCLPEYKIEENKALSFYANKLGLSKEMPYDVHLADKRMMITEAYKYMPNRAYWNKQACDLGENEFGFELMPFDAELLRDEPLSPKEAAKLFADKWVELGLPVDTEFNNFFEYNSINDIASCIDEEATQYITKNYTNLNNLENFKR